VAEVTLHVDRRRSRRRRVNRRLCACTPASTGVCVSAAATGG